MRYMTLNSIFIVALSIFLASCGNPELGRPEAAKLLESSQLLDEFRKNLVLMPNGKEIGFAHGWWNESGGQIVDFSPSIKAEGSAIRQGISGLHHDSLVLNKPVDLTITVTGIAGERKASTRLVDFVWRYKNLPNLSRRIAIEGGIGTAVFQLYDDGWRLVELSAKGVTISPYPLSVQEKQEMERDIAAEKERRLAAERAAAEAKRVFEELIRKSGVPTKTINKYTIEVHTPVGSVKMMDIAVTDVGLEFTITDHQKFPTRVTRSTVEVGFASIRRPNDAAGYDHNRTLHIANDSTWGSVKSAPNTVQEFIDTANKSMSDWKVKFSDLVAQCGKSETWGCAPVKRVPD